MRVGSLFSGYGGLDMAVGGELAWYAEVEPAACRVMEAHHPGVPNLGDVTQVDWAAVEPVDVITGGYPCQPFSNAGMRRGKDDERHLWPYVRDALGAIRPRAAVLENVRGHLTLGFADVLADLADLGMSARWGVVRAADAGAPHDRPRLFAVAYTDGAAGSKHDKWPQAWKSAPRRNDASGCRLHASHWGKYGAAICRWTHVVGREAPEPTRNGLTSTRITAQFVEWMQGLPKGYVTGHGLTESDQLRLLGNGVVPHQAALALRLLGAA